MWFAHHLRMPRQVLRSVGQVDRLKGIKTLLMKEMKSHTGKRRHLMRLQQFFRVRLEESLRCTHKLDWLEQWASRKFPILRTRPLGTKHEPESPSTAAEKRMAILIRF
jgi:hypothetical protein